MEDNSFLDEFMIEADELLEDAEDGLLNLEGDGGGEEYNRVFRSFHSLKGASGMMGLLDLQAHMHLLEDSFESVKAKEIPFAEVTDYFLQGVDFARGLLKGETGNYTSLEILGSDKSDSTGFDNDFLKPLGVQIAVSSSVESNLTDKLNECGELLIFEFANHEEFIKKNKQVDILIFSKGEATDFSKFLLPTFVVDDDEVFKSGSYWGPLSSDIQSQSLTYLIYQAKLWSERNKCLTKASQLLIYQFTDLDDYLKEQGKDIVRDTLKKEIFELVDKGRNPWPKF